MKKNRFILFFLCAIFTFLNVQNVQSASGEASLPKLLTNESVEASTHWSNIDDVFWVVVTSYAKKIEEKELLGRKLSIYKGENKGFSIPFEYDAGPDHFLSMFQLADHSNNLMTIWISGSAYHFYIFNISEGKISLVFESGSHNLPELVDIDNDGKQEVLISEGAFLKDVKEKKIINYPTKTNIYEWNGKTYILTKTVPWESRLVFSKMKLN